MDLGRGDDLRRTRKRLGLTQREFADLLRVTPLTVHRWETGQSRPQRAARERLQQVEARAAAMAPGWPGRVAEPETNPLGPPALDFAGDPRAAALVAEALRLAHGHQFNPAFAAETARIDPLPHQRIAVYERMLARDPLRFLLADDAGAGKTIMTGLYLREMLTRGRLTRALVVPPAGLVGNWERELRELFRLRFRIVSGRDLREGDAFRGADSDLAIVSLDTLARESAFAALRDESVRPYDLVVFDEAHKLSAQVVAGRTATTRRYRLAEALAGVPPATRTEFAGLTWSARHLLLLTATPHMGRDEPYHFLWRLLDPHLFSTGEACRRAPEPLRTRHFIRRTKEEMVTLEGAPLYRPRRCGTFSYRLTPGPDGEETLYRRTTEYLRDTYGRALTNRPAAQLAMGVFQRRLASSTHAVLRSFERRIEKLRRAADDLESGRTDARQLRERQRRLDERHCREDWYETHTADEEAGPDAGDDDRETYEDAALGVFVEDTVEGLRREIETLDGLRDHARRLLDAGDESKFDRLREVLEAHEEPADDAAGAAPAPRDAKWLVFTEHRDTADHLVHRLEGLGFSGQVALIHGGLAWREREEQVEHFRDPEGARYLVATDAAGEGINLQFCSRMANYDIPWNPARLEQRMGRIHRYGQRREVRIANLIAGDTYEGRVLEVLLEKLDRVREELSSDKVFDVIGRLFEGRSLGEVMLRGLTGARGPDDPDAPDGPDAPADPERVLGDRLTAERVRAVSEEQQRIYGKPGEVEERLEDLRADLAREQYLELLPAYVRLFVERAARFLGLEVRGDPDGVFTLAAARAGALDPLLPALEAHPEPARARLSVRRPTGEGDAPRIWLHPGEPVFDALTTEVRRLHARDARRGAIFVDPRAKAPYFFHLALVSVERRPEPRPVAGQPGLFVDASDADPELIERRLVGIRHAAGASPTTASVEGLTLLRPAREIAPGGVPLAARGAAMRAEAASLAEQVREELTEDHRTKERRALPERRRELAVGFDLKAAELAARRARLGSGKRASEEEEWEAVRGEQRRLGREKRRAFARLEEEPGRIVPGEARLLLHALVVPTDDPEEKQQYDESVEEIAVRLAIAWEQEHGRVVRDVSKPALARRQGFCDWPGFDLLSRGPDGEERCIEVKGRADRGAVSFQDNEWKQACNKRETYWLYLVLDCATSPTLFPVRDPFRIRADEQVSFTYTIPASRLVGMAEKEES